jgi:hypothetical protein
MTEKCYNHGCAIFTRPLRKRHTRRGAADEESAAADTNDFRSYAALGWKARSGLFLKRGETMRKRIEQKAPRGPARSEWHGYLSTHCGGVRDVLFYPKEL